MLVVFSSCYIGSTEGSNHVMGIAFPIKIINGTNQTIKALEKIGKPKKRLA